MPDVTKARRSRWALWAAIAWYLILSILLVRFRPGFQYDEAIDVLGSVHMRHSNAELALPHDPSTWLCAGKRCIPLMSARYIGSVKEYVCLPLFALFGPSAEVVRLVAMVFSAFGILGLAMLLARHVSYPVGAATAWALALHPSYFDLSILDNSAFSPWMAVFGALCLAVSSYLSRPGALSAFWIGVAAGLGVWARANFVWLLAAIAIAAAVSLGRRAILPVRHLSVIAVGGVIGGLPFLVYQVLSQGGTFAAVELNATTESWRLRTMSRLILFSRTMLSDGEHRAIWNGPPLPGWQLWLFPALMLAGCLVCLLLFRHRLARAISVTLLVLTAIFFGTTLRVAEHHMVTAVPLAVSVGVLACAALLARYRWSRAIVAAVAIVYVGSALYWQVSTLNGVARTGGTGVWSDGIYTLTRRLVSDFSYREVRVLDWGLQNSLYVLSDGRIRSREVYWDATATTDEFGRPWADTIRDGGVFLVNGPDHYQFPQVTAGFLRALASMQPTCNRVPVFARSGQIYAEIIAIEPNTAHSQSTAVREGAFEPVLAGEARSAFRLTGMHAIEEGHWRWTTRAFSVTLDAPVANDLRLSLKLHVPADAIEKLGAITMSIRLGQRTLSPETFRRSGDYSIYRDLRAEWIAAGPNRFDFQLDKWQPPGKDQRELGVIFVSAALDAR